MPFSPSLFSWCALLWTCTLVIFGWTYSGSEWLLPVALTALPLMIVHMCLQPAAGYAHPEWEAHNQETMARVAQIVADNVHPAIVESLEGFEAPSTVHSCEILNATIAESWGDVSNQLEQLIADSVTSYLHLDSSVLTDGIVSRMAVDVCLGDNPPTLINASVHVNRESNRLVLAVRMRFSPDYGTTRIQVSFSKWYHCALECTEAEAPFIITLPLENVFTNFGLGMRVYLAGAPRVTLDVRGSLTNFLHKHLPVAWRKKFDELKQNFGRALIAKYFKKRPAPYLIYPYSAE